MSAHDTEAPRPTNLSNLQFGHGRGSAPNIFRPSIHAPLPLMLFTRIIVDTRLAAFESMLITELF
jgi:hypothetical protein